MNTVVNSDEIVTTKDDALRENSILKESYSDNSMLVLPLGEELKYEDMYTISSVEPSTFVVLAGPIGCGKTTLVTSIYQQFFTKQSQDYYFAGSQTLQAFEKRAFFNRVQSNQAVPQMQRTARGSLDSILHLRIWHSPKNMFQNLLISDFSGEDYEDVSGDIDTAKEDFGMIRNAKFLVIILDGANIASKRFKHKELQKATQLLRTFFDADILHPLTEIVIILSKYDVVYNQFSEQPDLKGFVEKIGTDISEKIPSLKSKILFQKVAAMPDNISEINIGYGISDLMNIFFNYNEIKIDRFNEILKTETTSQFNLFGERVLK